MSKQAMKLALEALQEVYFGSRSAKHDEAITALREALAEQPAQQEPVDSTQISKVWWDGEKLMAKPIPFVEFYKSAQRKPLTDEEIMAIGKELGLKCRLGGNPNIDFDYARAIEAALNIKE